MISVLEHIEYLITRHDCVVVPGFGAFIAQHESAYCDADGIWHSPKRVISFNAELTHNDGLIVNSIMRKENCAFGVAVNEIRESVANFHKQLTEDGELAFGNIGIFKFANGKIGFVPRRDAACEYFGLRSFSMSPLNVVSDDLGARQNVKWQFSIDKNYLKIAASILVLLVLSFVLSTPVSINNGKQEYASMNNFELTSNKNFPFGNEIRELAITMPVEEPDSVVVKGFRSMGKKVDADENSHYYLIVCSAVTQAEANRFIARQKGDYEFKILHKNGKYRVYVARGKSVPEMMEQKYAIADEYPDAWVHFSR